MGPGKAGRNDPCWCGSGKEYKKCHLAEDEKREAEQSNRFPRAAATSMSFRAAGGRFAPMI